MQYRRLWTRSCLSLALTIGVVSYLEPPTTILAVPQVRERADQSTSMSVFTDRQSVSQSSASHQVSQQSADSQVDRKLRTHTDSELTGTSRASTALEKDGSKQISQRATTRATQIVNGSVTMTLDTDGTLHLSGGSFYVPVSIKAASWIAKELTAQGASPDQVLKIKIEGRITTRNITDYGYLFAGLVNLTNVDGLANLDIANVTSLKYLFQGDQRLQQIDFGQSNFSKVQSFEGMFYNCSALTNIAGISQWDTSGVTNLAYMFSGASSLTSLPISTWNTSKVTILSYTFYNCSSLVSLDVARWDTHNVTKMQSTFANDIGLKTLDVAGWDTRSVENLDYAFKGLTSLTSLPVDKWNTSRLGTMVGVFAKSPKLVTLPIGNWDVSNVTNMNSAFLDCTGLKTLPVATWKTQNVTNMGAIFKGVSGLATLPVAGWNTVNVENMELAFAGMSSLNELPVAKWQTGKVKRMGGTFREISKVTDLQISGWDTSQVTDMSFLFYGNPQFETLPIANWNTAKVTNFESVFENTNLEKLDLSGWDTNQAQNYKNAFGGKLPPKQLWLGQKFNFFNSTSWGLPDPSRDAPYVGKWRRLNDNKIYTSTDLMTKYDVKYPVSEFEWVKGKTITVKYVDTADKSLAPDTQIAGTIGDNYQLKPIEIDGYLPENPNGVQGTFTDEDAVIKFVYRPGNLVFVSAPRAIDFGQNKITGKSETYDAKYDTGLVVKDNRPLGSTWSLNATLVKGGFVGEKSAHSLTGVAVLSYQDQQKYESTLIPDVAISIVNGQKTVSHEVVNVLGPASAMGVLRLNVPTDRVSPDTYKATVTWTLNQGVANK
ncbi:BspA family leucine-rich repeat surface protein [Lactiplantibacillus daoliensis]|uniref:BspA family leucine-rich repeat surface protein n=1 Tax=Lactiplantibacillus daoliensis TaxID=2559916 RepID=A0ABW1UEJ1_9LACO|nr:BspA family leucine-rich repeat surface protein [Lactiplantibacillus daoliensis]